MDKTFSIIKEQIQEWIRMDYIVPEDIPAIELYMDQITTFMDRQLEKTKRSEDEKILTKTMINNYTKNELLPPPNKKKYSKNHIILLIFIYYLKNFLTISDIKTLLTPMIEQYFDEADDSKDNRSLLSIYADIFELEHIEFGLIEKSLYEAYRLADRKFNDKDEEYLHTVAYISILSYDIYAKKQIIESLIDNLKLPEENAADKKDAKKDVKKDGKKN